MNAADKDGAPVAGELREASERLRDHITSPNSGWAAGHDLTDDCWERWYAALDAAPSITTVVSESGVVVGAIDEQASRAERGFDLSRWKPRPSTPEPDRAT